MTDTSNEEDWDAAKARFLACNWKEHAAHALRGSDLEGFGWANFGILPRYRISQCTTSRTFVTLE